MSGTVLLVEDEPLVRATVGGYLEALGLTVLTAEAAGEATRLCDAHVGPIDLLVTDIILPEATGPVLAERVRQRHPHIGVLFMSANPERLEIEVGADVKLQKPFDARELAEAVDEALKAKRPATARAAHVAGRTVLLVEDHTSSRMALRDLLETNGYRVLEAATPAQALEVVASHSAAIDVMLTDVLLPGMRGDVLAQRIVGAHPAVRVIFMTGLTEPLEGADAIIHKPIDVDDLMDVLARTLASDAPVE